MGYVTTDEIVKELLIEQGKNTPHQYLRLLKIANKGLKELTFDVLGDVQSTLMGVSSSLRCDLPSDYVDYTFIGLIGSDGLKHTLGIKKNIPLGTDDNTIIQNTSDSSLFPPSLQGVVPTLYGLGGGQNSNGHYAPVIDKDNWQLIVSSVAAGEFVYMEYITDGSVDGGNTIVHPYAEEALTAYIYWKSIQRVKGYSNADREYARRDFYNEKRLLVSRLQAFTKEELLQTIRKGFKQSPRK